jgi:hypothetical protein
MDNVLKRLEEGTGRDLHTLQVKLTYVDSQLKGRASVAFTTFYHLLQMKWFLPLRSPDLSYGNDDFEVWNFTVDPEEMRRVMQILSEMDGGIGSDVIVSPHLSLMVVLEDSRLGAAAYEAVFDTEQSKNVSQAIRDALDEGNGVGRKVMDLLSL